jgi:DNA mismatch repair protein MutL
MERAAPNISENRPQIRQLDEGAINRIAAGEVVERPASAVKELIENAIDAGATRIALDVADGGKTLIRLRDNGCGMTADDLPMALSRHATSKIDGSDLLNIHSFGFRGEALPALGAVGRLKITSRAAGHEAAEILVEGSKMHPVRPAALNEGTVVELRDLFYATPARLKFMRTDRAELQAILDITRRLAMAEPQISFTLRDVSGGGEGRILFRADAQTGDLFTALSGRLSSVLGREFAQNAIAIDATRDGLRLTGYAALPTFSRGAAVMQYLFVNDRPVRDKLLLGAVRAAYFDFLSRDRHPAVALFLSCPPELVDVNVHPAKSEVRFRDPGLARGLVISALRHALAEAGHRASSTVGGATLGAMRPEGAPSAAAPPLQYQYTPQTPSRSALSASQIAQAPQPGFADMAQSFSASVPEPCADNGTAEDLPLGVARGQVHENYIIAQTKTGMVIVDQHAAHERLVYEQLKAQMAENGVKSQALLIPDIIDLPADAAALLLEHVDDLAQLGLRIEPFGGSAIAVRETPALLGEVASKSMIEDIVDELQDSGSSQNLQARLEAILSRIACHGSVRSGRRMRPEEMNALLRQMEATPHSGQCNHGRPTYVELPLRDIERLFGRS